jgi:predicted nucleotide-binding protein
MGIQEAIKVLKRIREDAESLKYQRPGGYDRNVTGVLSRLDKVVDKIFDDPEYRFHVKFINFYPPVNDALRLKEDDFIDCFYEGKNDLINLIKVIEEDLTLTEIVKDSPESMPENDIQSSNVFIVHGHNNEMKEAVARVVESLGLKPIILHERPNKGKTIIEKFTDYSRVGFAIILLSADDYGFSKKESETEKKLRARQNVVLEMGFFLGKLGREKVLLLYEAVDNFEIPSDYDGVVYTQYDSGGAWKSELVRELKAADFDIDANALYRN